MERHELAWAAGFFDGEGWSNRTGRGVQARINQAGPHGIPEVLVKFQRVVGVGRIAGPEVKEGRVDLYHWVVSSRADVARVADLIGPWLGPVKRAELERALRLPLAPIVWPGSSSEELAWAGGFFDGEGSTYLLKHRTHPGHLVPEVYVPQSGRDGVPVVLSRFRAALGEIGTINGPHSFKWANEPVYRWRTCSLRLVPLALHRLMPFIGSVKRAQAIDVLTIAYAQPDLPRGNPAFGEPGSRFCPKGHDKFVARIRPYAARKEGGTQRRDSSWCPECLRIYGKMYYARKRAKNATC